VTPDATPQSSRIDAPVPRPVAVTTDLEDRPGTVGHSHAAQIQGSRSGTEASCPSGPAHRRGEGAHFSRARTPSGHARRAIPSEVAEGTLHALQRSLRAIEKHRDAALDEFPPAVASPQQERRNFVAMIDHALR
jgi:hypothetical protein